MNTSSLKELLTRHRQLLQKSYEIPLTCPFQDPSFYGDWLSQHYYYIRHTTRLLALAASRIDPSSKMHHRFLEHAAEEKGHEKLILRDLKGLNLSLEDFPELPMTAQMYQAQYYLVEYVSPIALLGYPLFLEGLSCYIGPHIYEATKKNFGQKASSFIKVHADQDVEHIQSLNQALEQLPPEELAHVRWSLEQTANIYQNLLGDLLAKHQNQKAWAA